MTNEGFAPFLEGYRALRTGGGFVELRDWTSVSVTGRDRQAFLQNFTTNDIKRLTPRASCETFFTNVKGKVVGHGVVDCRDEELVIVGPPGQGARLVEHLDRYVIREDVSLRDESRERAYFLVRSDRIELASRPTIMWDLIGEDSYAVVEVPRREAARSIHQLQSSGAVLVGDEAFTAARVEAGFPYFGVDFDVSNLPQEVGRDRQAISFTKGCYLGQETVARIDALGHVNQKLAPVRFATAEVPAPRTELLHTGKVVGRVTSAALSPMLGSPLALAMVRREANAVGTKLESTSGPAEVVAFPATTGRVQGAMTPHVDQ